MFGFMKMCQTSMQVLESEASSLVQCTVKESFAVKWFEATRVKPDIAFLTEEDGRAIAARCNTSSLSALDNPVRSRIDANFLWDTAVNRSVWRGVNCSRGCLRRKASHVHLDYLTTEWQQIIVRSTWNLFLQTIELISILNGQINAESENWPIPLFRPMLYHEAGEILIKTIDAAHAVVVYLDNRRLLDFNVCAAMKIFWPCAVVQLQHT